MAIERMDRVQWREWIGDHLNSTEIRTERLEDDPRIQGQRLLTCFSHKYFG